jgi:DNA-binding Lrp family transcriptional regulator
MATDSKPVGTDLKWLLYRVIVPAAAAGILVAVVAFYLASQGHGPTYLLEVGKAGLQLAGVAAIGGFVTYAIEAHKADREAAEKLLVEARTAAERRLQRERNDAEREKDRKREERRRQYEYRISLLRRLRDAYGDIKRVRRRLEAAGFKDGATRILDDKMVAAYDTNMMRLVDTKLDLEAIRDEIKAWPAGEAMRAVHRHVEALDEYLGNTIVDEFRKLSPVDVDRQLPLTVADFPQVQRFTGHASYEIAGSFKVATCHYHAALWLLSRELYSTSHDAPLGAPDGLPAAGAAQYPGGPCPNPPK